jgi:hypothetical protein
MVAVTVAPSSASVICTSLRATVVTVALTVSTSEPVETAVAATWVLPARSLAPVTSKVTSARSTLASSTV